MKFLRMLAFAVALTAYAAFLPTGASAAAGTFTCPAGTLCPANTTLHAESEGKAVLDAPFGNVECNSTVEGHTTTTGEGGTAGKADGPITALNWSNCGSDTVTTLATGTLSVESTGALTSTGAKVTVEHIGTHCIYETSGTTIGTLTSANAERNATLDISATIPRVGGRSGAFCGSSAPWTGSYKFTKPTGLVIEGGGGGKTSTTTTTSLSGESKSGAEITVNEGAKVKDTATLSGTNAGKATGTVKYKVYADKECKELATSAGEVTVKEGKVPASEEKELEAGRVYYWQAEYSGDSSNEASKSTCGKEILTVKAATSLTTSLSGESKTGEEITVNEGSKAKDTATLSGTRSSSATGKVKFRAYKDKECKELASEAGEGSLSEGKASSEEKSLEAGAIYYWQAEYPGDSLHQASKSTCGSEVLTVKATTSLSTSLSGEAKSGEEVTILEGSKAKDTATLSGTRSSTATGKAKYKVYADKECKELVTNAGEVTVTSGSVPASEEKELEAGRVYYWQVSYEGDSLHRASTSTCGKEVLTVKASTSLTTLLAGENPGGEEPIEGEEITIGKGSGVVDSATLGGTKSSTATGEVSFDVYADGECNELVAEAGDAELEEGSAAPSEEVELEEGTYYWQASYEGDSLHQASTSSCTEVVHVIAGTSLATTLSGESEEGDMIEVSEEAVVTDTATLSGPKAAEATGNVKYFVYSDVECKELVTEAGEITVAGESVPASNPITLEPGVYYWQAIYSGDSFNLTSISPCRSEVEMVVPPVTTTLSGGGESAGHIKVIEGTPVHDEATLHGKHVSEATGSVEYFVYADAECEVLFAEAGEVEVKGASVPASGMVEFEEPGTYYWQADYSGDEQNPAATSACGTEVTIVSAPTSVTTSLSGGEKEGAEITVEEGTPVSDQATLGGPEAASATGSVSYTVYEDSGCTEAAAPASIGEVDEGVAEPSSEVTLPPGTYYWQAEYWGDGVNAESIEECGAEVEVVTAPITTFLFDGSQSGTDITVEEGTAVTDQAILHGEHAGEASGTIEYFVYEDEECKELFANAGKSEFKEGKVPASSPVELEEPGVYWWRAKYSGDGKNPPAAALCGSEKVQVAPPDWRYAAFGNSYSSGEGVRETINGKSGSFYEKTNTWWIPFRGHNVCHRSARAWPALVAEKAFGAVVGPAAVQPPKVFEKEGRFIFRSCSGALTKQVWPEAGKYEEWEEPTADWKPAAAQITWLPAPPENKKVMRVSVGIGGNDAGFSKIIWACWTWDRGTLPVWLVGQYNPAPCLAEIKHREEVGFAEIEEKLPPVLEEISKKAPKAEIKVFLYPKPLNLLKKPEIPVGLGKVIDNQVEGPVPGTARVETAAKAIETYVAALNDKIAKTMAAAKVERTEVVNKTQDAFTKFGNHRLGDPQPWLNKFAYYLEESFHPNVCGQQAVARIAQPFLTVGAAAPVDTTC
jgi:hypothetical protein